MRSKRLAGEMVRSATRRGRRGRATIAALAGAAGLMAGGYALYQVRFRPWQERWGAIDDEVLGTMTGDDIIPYPVMNATRAITINAPPEAIWPWLVQIGYQRAGFYSADRIERLLGLRGIRSAAQIVPEFQQLKVGDLIPFGPQVPRVPVLAIEPLHLLALGGYDPQYGGATWVFELRPVNEHQTRLVTRTRARWPNWNLRAILSQRPNGPDAPAPNLMRDLPMYLFFEPGSFLLLRQMLMGIKQRAETMALEARESSMSPGENAHEGRQRVGV